VSVECECGVHRKGMYLGNNFVTKKNQSAYAWYINIYYTLQHSHRRDYTNLQKYKACVSLESNSKDDPYTRHSILPLFFFCCFFELRNAFIPFFSRFFLVRGGVVGKVLLASS
jgi:hypothetical protein